MELGIEKIDIATTIAKRSSRAIGIMLDPTANTCFCTPYEECVSSMELSTCDLLYVVYPDGEIE